ncbi:MAG: hypothetical protein ACLGHF_05140, partial [Alphaproteobacteria bacterium]
MGATVVSIGFIIMFSKLSNNDSTLRLNLFAIIVSGTVNPHFLAAESWTPATTPRVWGHDLIHSVHWTERFDALTQPVFAGGAPGAAEQGRRPA